METIKINFFDNCSCYECGKEFGNIKKENTINAILRIQNESNLFEVKKERQSIYLFTILKQILMMLMLLLTKNIQEIIMNTLKYLKIS